MIAWDMLTRGEDYAFGRPSLVREKLRRAELICGADRPAGTRNPVRVVITYADRRRGWVVVDVRTDEVEDVAKKGRKQGRRVRRRDGG